MEKNMKQMLLDVLENLLEYPFKKFKSRLGNSNYDERGTIPKSQLEKADPVDLVNLMCDFYTEHCVINVCISVLEEINERNLAEKLRGQRDKDLRSTEIPGKSARDFRLQYKDYIFKKIQIMSDCNSRLGEHVLLNERYSQLIILNHHRSEEEREHEIMSSGKKHVQMLRERTRSSITIESLFSCDENGLIPDVVVLQGVAGIGKTMTAKKITLDCARGDLYQDMFDYTFYINCREMNLLREECSIAEMILKSWADKDWSREILKNPERLLFIIDGFDELRYSLDLPEDGLCTDPWEKQPAAILLNSLFRRKLLPKSYLIITTRPTAQAQLRQCLNFSRYAEILGFSEKEREEYFYKFFQDRELAAQAFGHVKQNETLFTMCFVPVVCWIVCTVMKQQMEKSKDLTQSSKTLTSIYVLYLCMLKSQHNQSKQFLNKNLKALCSLALDGIGKREILFREDEIRKRGLDQEDSLPLFLSESIFQRDIDCECVYSFIHLSFQEFFAALSYILDEENALNSEKPDPDLKTLLESVMTSRPDFESTVHFLFGLLNKQTMKDLGEKFEWKISPKIKEFLQEWVKNSKQTVIHVNSRNDKLLLECLYEMQDEKLAKLAMDHVTGIVWSVNTTMEDKAVAYCLEFCCSLKNLCVMAPREDKTLDKEVLRNALIRPHRFSLTEVHCKDLAQVLRKNPTLKELHLSNTTLEDAEMKLLCEGLKYCKLEYLRLRDCFLTEACCQDLVQVLRNNQRLTELVLSDNRLKDTGMKQLCEGLQHPGCTPQGLGLADCYLTVACCQDLVQVLQNNQRLTELDLSGNILRDTGMKQLCEGLQHPGCTLQVLRLDLCSLTEASCQDLAQLLWKNQTLKLLHLSGNNFKDTGMKLLCEGLKHPKCKLQSLGLSWNSLTEACCQDLAQVLWNSQRLTLLDLALNVLEDTGMKLLCEGLKRPECKLQSLRVLKCCLTEACCPDLAEVLRKNQRLKTLDLSENELKDTGMKQLCVGLQHPDCKLESLRLADCGVTHAILEDLSSAIKKNQSLTHLDVSGGKLRDPDIKTLHEALEFSCSRR